MKKHIALFTLILIFVCAGMCSCAKIPADMPDDFAIRFTFQTGDNANIYDTYTGTIQKDLIKNGAASASFTPSEETLEAIYAKWKECSMSSIKREITDSALSRDGTHHYILPTTSYEITVTVDGRIYTVKGELEALAFRETNEDVDHFFEFIEFMQQIFYDEADNQNLPEAVGGYL